MKKTILAMFVLAMAFFAYPAYAIPITINDTNAGVFNGADVGVVDTLIATTTVLGSPTSEEIWINSILSPSTVSFVLKIEPVHYFNTSETDVYAFDLSANDDYFIVKNSTMVGLFANLADVDWGVFDASTMAGFNVGDGDYTISHVTEFSALGGGGSTTVPEPSIAALLGMGLVGIGMVRRQTHS